MSALPSPHTPHPPLVLLQLQLMDSNLSESMQMLGNCSRVRFNALPYNVTLMSTGFIEIWLVGFYTGFSVFVHLSTHSTHAPHATALQLLLPFGLFDSAWFGLLPYFFCALTLLGADEVANQLEDPFQCLPTREILQDALNEVQRCAVRSGSWVSGVGQSRAEQSRVGRGTEGLHPCESMHRACNAVNMVQHCQTKRGLAGVGPEAPSCGRARGWGATGHAARKGGLAAI